jgi:hypothetical protein
MAERLDVLGAMGLFSGQALVRSAGPIVGFGPSCHEQVLVHDLLHESLREPAPPPRRSEKPGSAGDLLDQLGFL